MKSLLFAASGFLVGVVFAWSIFTGSAYIFPIGKIALRAGIGDQLLVIDGNTGGVTKVYGHGQDPWRILRFITTHRDRMDANKQPLF